MKQFSLDVNSLLRGEGHLQAWQVQVLFRVWGRPELIEFSHIECIPL